MASRTVRERLIELDSIVSSAESTMIDIRFAAPAQLSQVGIDTLYVLILPLMNLKREAQTERNKLEVMLRGAATHTISYGQAINSPWHVSGRQVSLRRVYGGNRALVQEPGAAERWVDLTALDIDLQALNELMGP